MHGSTKEQAFVRKCMSFYVVMFAQVQLQCTSMLPTVKLNIQTCAKLLMVNYFTMVPTSSEQLFKLNDRYLTQPHPAFQLAKWPGPDGHPNLPIKSKLFTTSVDRLREP